MKTQLKNTIDKPYTSDEIKDYVSERTVSSLTKLILEKGMFDLLVNNEDLLKTLNESNHKFFLENYEKIPKGLEKKIHLHWFQHCFNWDNDDYHFCDLFKGNWSEVPFPNATSMRFGTTHFSREFDIPPNWSEIFIIVNDLLFENRRLVDFGITSIEYDSKDSSINFWCSS